MVIFHGEWLCLFPGTGIISVDLYFLVTKEATSWRFKSPLDFHLNLWAIIPKKASSAGSLKLASSTHSPPRDDSQEMGYNSTDT